MPDALTTAKPTSLDTILNRASVPARMLGGPVPDAGARRLAVSAALRAPDHGGLQPWRFLFIEGEARHALGDLLAASFARRVPDASPDKLDVERAKPLRAPLVVVAGAALRHGHGKIPVWEQEAAAAAGTMNFLNALEAMGFGSIWVSSPALSDPTVKTALGFAETDGLIGWLYVGTPTGERPRPARPEPDPFYRTWSPSA